MLFPTTLVGSYPQPDWLIDRRRLTENIPPRVRASDLWRLPEPWLAAAQDDATLLAIRAQEDAGIDIVTDGDVVQIDEPYMQAQPEKARSYGITALNRALEGIEGTTAVHICFGYSAYLKNKPSGYAFLPEFAGCACRQISIETAEPKLDCAVLEKLPGKQIMVGCIDLSTPQVEPAGLIVARVKRA